MRSLSESRGVEQSAPLTDLGSLVSMRVRLRPGAHWHPGVRLAGCSEHVAYLIDGEVQALSYGSWVSFTAGQAARIHGEAPAIWRNPGQTGAEILWVGRKA